MRPGCSSSPGCVDDAYADPAGEQCLFDVPGVVGCRGVRRRDQGQQFPGGGADELVELVRNWATERGGHPASVRGWFPRRRASAGACGR